MEDGKPANVLLGAIVVVAAAVGVFLVLSGDYSGTATVPASGESTLPPIDPALIKYTELRPIRTGFPTVQAIAVDPKDNVYVACGKLVRLFTPDGVKLRDVTLPFEPTALAVDAEGLLYVALADHVWVFGAATKPKAVWDKIAGKPFISSLAVSEDSVYVADAGGHVVRRYDKSGKLLNTLAKKDPGRGIDGLVLPSPYLDVAVGPDGLIRVANPGRLRVEVYTPQGDLMAKWGDASLQVDGFCGCCNPSHLAMLPDGRVVTSEKGVPRVKVYSKDGRFDCVVAAPKSFQGVACSADDCRAGKTLDLAVNSKGVILVLDPAPRDVRMFVPNKEATE